MKFIYALLGVALSISIILHADRDRDDSQRMICNGKHEFEPCGGRLARATGQCVKLVNNQLACRRPGEFCLITSGKKPTIVKRGLWGKDIKGHLACIESKREATTPMRSFRIEK